MEDVGGIEAGEGPVDLESLSIDRAIPGGGIGAQSRQGWETPRAEALTGEDANFDLRLIEPAGMFGRVVDGEATPDCVGFDWAKMAHQRTPGMRTQVVHHQMDGACVRVGMGETQ